MVAFLVTKYAVQACSPVAEIARKEKHSSINY
jgi:hypothetical protein